MQPFKHQNLIGHEKLEENFVNLCHTNKIPHAIILSGEKGIGKSTLAYKISRFILDISSRNYENNQDIFTKDIEYPNNLNIEKDSQIFKEVSMGINQNLFVVGSIYQNEEDNKNEITVDDVRNLKVFFERKSMNNSWRIAIIDSADNLNNNASNALLKLLEEPPMHCLIILVSHIPGGLLKTIKSRCIIYKFNSLKFEEFKNIVNQIKPKIKKNEIEFLGYLSSNRPGYCLQILDLNGIEIYNKIINIFSKMPILDFEEINNLINLFNNKINNESFNLFIDLVNDFIHRGVVNLYNINNSKNDFFKYEIKIFDEKINENNVIQIIDCWSTLKDTIDKGKKFNLNKKNIVNEIFYEFSKCFN